MAQQQPIQIAGRMEGNCKALIGRCNRLFPGFHGTTEQMGKFGAIKKKVGACYFHQSRRDSLT